MATDSSNFIALGKAAHGFQTQATEIDHGVNVQGTKCGIYGESLNKAGALREGGVT
jgi:hypothetical protein